jgi:hypothetical protein
VSTLLAVAAMCPYLNVISTDVEFTEAEIIELVQRCYRLSHITLGDNLCPTDAVVRATARHCAHLYWLDLPVATRLSEAALTVLVRHASRTCM